MTIKEKCAYIKGLAEGLSLDETKPEARLISELISLVTDMADELEEAEDDIDELTEYAEELDHDLGDVESYVFECDDDDDDDCDCCCDDDDDDDDDWDECDDCDCDDCEGCEDDYYEIECPHCGETVCFEEGTEPEDMICPACNKKFSDAD